MIDLRGKVVVITGASSGLGREAAIQFARRGCTVVLAARREDALLETQRLSVEAGGRAVYQVTDISHEDDVGRLATLSLEQSGEIDVWVNNAGVTLSGVLEDAPFDEHRRVIETNLYGALFGARAMLPILRRQKRGTPINV